MVRLSSIYIDFNLNFLFSGFTVKSKGTIKVDFEQNNGPYYISLKNCGENMTFQDFFQKLAVKDGNFIEEFVQKLLLNIPTKQNMIAKDSDIREVTHKIRKNTKFVKFSYSKKDEFIFGNDESELICYQLCSNSGPYKFLIDGLEINWGCSDDLWNDYTGVFISVPLTSKMEAFEKFGKEMLKMLATFDKINYSIAANTTWLELRAVTANKPFDNEIWKNLYNTVKSGEGKGFDFKRKVILI